MSDVQAWMAGRLPEEWFAGEPEVVVDRDEITVVGTLPPVAEDEAGDAREAQAGRIARWREETRRQRMRIADEAEERFGRKVAWGAVCGETRQLFTHLAVPVMTRLRQHERRVLDTLVESGVARSRADALAWTVRLVGQHEEEWLASLQDALTAVREARDAGPAAGRAS
jgi:hypothetical protein